MSQGTKRRGTNNGASKLTPEKVRDIRRRYVPRTNTSALAAEFGVNPHTIRAIVNGEIWGWLDEND